MPEEWRNNTLIPLFKNKGDAQICVNYKGIKLLRHTMKLWERMIERKLDKKRGTSPVGEPEVPIGEKVVKSTTKYKYLGSIIQKDGDIDGDVVIRPALLYGTECWLVKKIFEHKIEVTGMQTSLNLS
ncbi:uncharacterized protein LOC130810880 [Amaranthus tricolor]|uniref:uncharacterized protein LOC130810880 n=1 Tax=Amaranthus tricolor TaxID=29722 RepID=UPI00258DFD58|nr:uncharacterized protein LOC130810880 [Amaranthus tricolor]